MSTWPRRCMTSAPARSPPGSRAPHSDRGRWRSRYGAASRAADSACWSPILFTRLTRYADFNARIAERPEQLRLLRDAAGVARDLVRLDPCRYRPVLRQALRKLARELAYLVPTREQAAEARALRREARGLTLAVWRDRLRPW